jgi:cell wall-associated NlpC family hydrolase
MTLRRIAQISLLATALAVGAASLPMPAAAAHPATAAKPAVVAARTTVSALSVHSVAASQRGDDPLVGLAVKGLDAWMTYRLTGDGKALQQFRVTRDVLASKIAQRIGVPPKQMITAWRAADVAHQLVIVTSLTQLGTPYHGFQSRPGKGFDCSGFTSWVWAQAGVHLARISSSQIRSVAPRTAATAQAGDLAYYPGHVMLYLGVADAIVHAPRTGENVSVGFIGKHHQRSAKYGDPLG